MWGSCNLGLLVSLTTSTRSHSFIHYASAAGPYLSLSNMPTLCCLRAFVCALLSAWETIHPGMRQPCPSHSFRSHFRCYPEGPLTSKFKGAPSSQPQSASSYFPHRTSSSLMLPCVLALYSWNVTLVLFKAVIPANGTMSGTAWCIWCLLNDWNTNQLVRFWGLYNTFHRPKPFPAVFQFSHSFVSHSLRPHGLQHDRLPCPSPTPRACPNSCPLSRWCHPTNSSSAVPFSCRQSFPDFQHFPAVFRLNLNAAFKMITSGFPFYYIRNDN